MRASPRLPRRTGPVDRALRDVRTGRFERSLAALTAAGAAITAGGDLPVARLGQLRQQDDVVAGGRRADRHPGRRSPPCSRKRAAKTVLPLASAAIVANGLQGTYLHCAGHRAEARAAGDGRYNMETGPPLFAPLLASLVGGMGLLAAVLRREDCASDALPRPDQRAITPQGRGRFPGFDVLAQARQLGRRHRRRRPRPARATHRGCPSSPPPRWRRRARPAGPAPRPGRRAARARARHDRRPAGRRETDGWHYDDMPEDADAWRQSLAALDADAQRPWRARRSPGWSPATARRSSSGSQDLGPTASRGAACRRTGSGACGPATRCAAFYSHPWAWNEMGFPGPAYPRGYKNLGIDAREPFEVPDADRHRSGDRHSRGARSCGPRAAAAGRPAAGPLVRGTDDRRSGPATSRPGCCPTTAPAPTTGCARTCAATTTTRRSTSSSSAPAPAAACSTQRLARAGWKVVVPGRRPVLGPRRRLGQRRARLAHAVLDRAPPDRRRRPGAAGLQQLRPWRRRVDGALRRLRAAVPPLGLRAPSAPTGSAPTGRSTTPTCGPTTSRSRHELPVAGQHWPWGDPHGYPHHPHPVGGNGDDLPARAPTRPASRRGSARSPSPTGASATGRTASTAGSACRAARSTPRPAR